MSKKKSPVKNHPAPQWEREVHPAGTTFDLRAVSYTLRCGGKKDGIKLEFNIFFFEVGVNKTDVEISSYVIFDQKNECSEILLHSSTIKTKRGSEDEENRVETYATGLFTETAIALGKMQELFAAAKNVGISL